MQHLKLDPRMSENNSAKTSEMNSDHRSWPGGRSGDNGRKLNLAYSLVRMIGRLIPRFVFRFKTLYVLWLPREHWRQAEDQSGLRWATAADVECLETLGHRSQDVQTRLIQGDRVVIREIDGQVIGWVWFTQANPTYDGWLQFQLADNEYWIYDVFVSPVHRGEEISNQMGDFGRIELAKQGIINMAGVTNTLNHPALRSSEKVRYKFARFWYVRLLGLSLVRLPRTWRIGWWGLGRSLHVPLSDFTNAADTYSSI